MRAVVAASLLIVSCFRARAEAQIWACASRTDLPGYCVVLRRRMHPYNGGAPNVRIWPVGTKRLLGVEQAEDETVNIPPGLERWVEFGTLIFADFEVCPLTQAKPEHMRIVCVESAKNLRVERYSGDGGRPDVSYPAPLTRHSNEALQPPPEGAAERRR